MSVVGHEFAETATDPNLDAWWSTASGAENADKCAWTYGTVAKTSNWSLANVTLGARSSLVRRNWKNVAPLGDCALS